MGNKLDKNIVEFNFSSKTVMPSGPQQPKLSKPTPNLLEMPMIKVKKESKQSSIRVMTFNILADCYSSSFMQNYEDFSGIQPEARCPLILKLISHYNPDVIGLQEVDQAMWAKLEPTLKKEYWFKYHKRPNGKRDGIVLAYKQKNFLEVSFQHICFNKCAKEEGLVSNESTTYLTNNLAIIMRLREKVTGREFVVYNCYFYWDPKYDFVKYAQAYWVLRHMMRKFTPEMPIVIMGDLNSISKSNVVSLFNGQPPSASRIEIKDLTVQIMKETKTTWEKINPEVLKNYGLYNAFSAYKLIAESVKEGLPMKIPPPDEDRANFPDFTNYTKDFRQTIDHILFSKQFSLAGLCTIPSLEEMSFLSLPTSNFPSDHLPLVADLNLLN